MISVCCNNSSDKNTTYHLCNKEDGVYRSSLFKGGNLSQLGAVAINIGDVNGVSLVWP